MGNEEKIKFGKRLKALREERNIKQGQFADKIGISRQSMNCYETGKSSPDTETIIRIADFLECSTDYLLGRTKHKNHKVYVEFDESLSKLSEILYTIPEPWRNRWLDIFVGTAQWIGKDLNNDVLFHHSAIELFYGLMSLTDYCLTAKEKQSQNCYFEKERHEYSQKRFAAICQLRSALNDLDSISYENTDIPLENDIEKAISPEVQEMIAKMKQRL